MTDPIYFHTAFRNVSTYMALSFAALVYSRFYRSKERSIRAYNLGLIVLSLALLGVAAMINARLWHEQRTAHSPDPLYRQLTLLVMGVHASLATLGICTLWRQVRA